MALKSLTAVVPTFRRKEEIDESPSSMKPLRAPPAAAFLFFLGQGQEYLLYRQ